MERLRFGPEAALTLGDERLVRTKVAPLTEPLARGAPFQVGCFQIGAGGLVARHPASVPQLLAVVRGSGWVSGPDGERHEIDAGEAVFWDRWEEHETGTDEGLTAIVIEGEGLRPFAGR